MLLRVHRGDDRYDTLPQRIVAPAAGLSVRALIQLAAQCDLRLRAVRFDPECPDRLPHASIVHTVTAHYLLFDQLLAGGVRVLDPASGVRFLSLATFSRLSSGVALLAVTGGPAPRAPAARGEPGVCNAPAMQLGTHAPPVGHRRHG